MHLNNKYLAIILNRNLGKICDELREQLLSKGIFDVIVVEVSPNFGDISWVENLHSYTGEAYDWFELSEKGFLFKKPRLHHITPDEAKEVTSQFNLVLMHKTFYPDIEMLKKK